MNITRRLLLVLVLLLSGIGVGLMYASAQDDASHIISACVKMQNGQVRIVPTDEDCRPDEYPLAWGTQGEPGPAGPPGSGFQDPEVVWSSDDTFFPFAERSAVATCPVGKFAISGGGVALTETSAWMVESRPVGSEIPVPIWSPDGNHYLPQGSTSELPSGWVVSFANGSSGATAYAICVSVSP